MTKLERIVGLLIWFQVGCLVGMVIKLLWILR